MFFSGLKPRKQKQKLLDVLLVFDKCSFSFSDPDSRSALVSWGPADWELKFLFSLINGTWLWKIFKI